MTKDRKGSVIVFICIFFVTLVFMILIFADVSRQKAVQSSAQALSGLWADSLLAEYDLNLQKRYSIFGFYGYPEDVKKKVEFYASNSFKKKKYIDYQVTGCSLYPYALTNAEIMEQQLVSAGKLAFTEKFKEPDGDIRPTAGYTGAIGEKELFENLPSEGNKKGFSISSVTTLFSGGGTIGDIMKKTGDNWWINQYIFAYLKDASDEKGLGESFFRNEIEYVICGKRSDQANASSMRSYIITTREGANAVFLNKDPVKSAEAEAAAQLLTPGPGAVVTKQALILAWAYAESVNDYKLLMNGHKVPLMKTDKTWAVDLESVLQNTADGYIYTGVDVGETYQDYLRFFVYAMDSKVRTLRIMDLIQINMKKYYYKDFLLRDYNGGVNFVLEVNGKEHETSRLYEKNQ